MILNYLCQLPISSKLGLFGVVLFCYGVRVKIFSSFLPKLSREDFKFLALKEFQKSSQNLIRTGFLFYCAKTNFLPIGKPKVKVDKLKDECLIFLNFLKVAYESASCSIL